MKTNSGFRKWFVLGLFMFTVLAVPGATLWAEEETPTGDFTSFSF
jgi:hypothetical protein